MFVDSHCHIISEEFDEDREECLKRAQEAGVQVILDASGGVGGEKLKKNALVCSTHKNVFATVGVHPEEAEEYLDIKAEKIIELSDEKYVVGIGECGLDYHYNPNSKDTQLKVFVEHIHAAQKTKLPLIIHSREADDDMIKILAQEYEKEPFRGELHCFSSSRKLAEFALNIGFYVSASGIITFKKSVELREIFADVPMEKLLIETDAPYLAPEPYRGKRNEPAYVVKTAEKLAEIKGISLEQIAKITTENFHKLFDKTPKF
ncbi:MAG: TatD family hydrolase [Alphaproteobacteria bacterium]|nr:TatD family hydrolase [Alphaproteobacteria bacterium]